MAVAVDRQSLGKLGEDLACERLKALGYAVLARRHRTRFGEIDIVCERKGVVAFVEVKARRSTRHGTAVEAITPRKRRRMGAMALDYLAWHRRLEASCRFIVVAIDAVGTDRQTLSVVDDAFQFDS